MKIVTLLEKAYRQAPDEDFLNIATELLADLPDRFLLMATKEHIERSEWFPRISQLRDRTWGLVPGGETGHYMWQFREFGSEAAETMLASAQRRRLLKERNE